SCSGFAYNCFTVCCSSSCFTSCPPSKQLLFARAVRACVCVLLFVWYCFSVYLDPSLGGYFCFGSVCFVSIYCWLCWTPKAKKSILPSPSDLLCVCLAIICDVWIHLSPVLCVC